MEVRRRLDHRPGGGIPRYVVMDVERCKTETPTPASGPACHCADQQLICQAMIVYLNGRFIPQEEAVVSVFDRAFRYGDGLFEAVLARTGKLFRWERHWARLVQGAKFLRISLPVTGNELPHAINEVLIRNNLTDAMVRITLSRGAGPRGYAPSGQEQPVLVIDAWPVQQMASVWNVITASIRVPAAQPLLRHKTVSRLVQVLAAMEAREHGSDETLLLDTNGHVTEGASSNVFWVSGATVLTPPLSGGLLPGITRELVAEQCQHLGIQLYEKTAEPAELSASDGVFMSLSSRGVVEIASLDGTPLRRSPITAKIAAACEAVVARECA